MRCLLLCSALLLAGCGLQVTTTPSATTAPAAKVYTREEFKTLLLGKSKAEVLSLLGKPHSTHEGVKLEFWDYLQRTKDPISGKVDHSARIVFDRDKVSDISF